MACCRSTMLSLHGAGRRRSLGGGGRPHEGESGQGQASSAAPPSATPPPAPDPVPSASSSCTTTTPPPSSSAPPAESTPTEGEGARRAWPWPWSPAGAAGGHGTAGEGEIGEEICSTGSHTAGRGMDAAEERKNKEIRSRSRRNKAASACSRGASSGSLSSPRSGGRRGRLQIGRRERSPSLILYGRRDYATRNKQMPRCVEKVAGSCSGKKIELLARIGEK